MAALEVTCKSQKFQLTSVAAGAKTGRKAKIRHEYLEGKAALLGLS
jgi:hypothetical protein